MPGKGSRSSHWLNWKWWELTLGEWIGISLAFLAIVVLFCLLFIRRHSPEYHLQHTFNISAPEFVGSALALADPVLVGGNKLDLLENGDAYLLAIFGAIRNAKRSVNLECYIMESDETGRELRDLLCERARAGLQVRVLLDGVGSGWGLNNSDVRLMKDAGCKFAYYHPTHSWRVDRTNRRSHRRVIVVDGRLAFTGSAAFADKWSGHAQDAKHWRDMMVRIQGPLVGKLQAAFQQHWIKSYVEALSGANEFPDVAPVGNARAQIVTSQSFSMAPVPLLQATAFTAAEHRIWIVNSYCTPTNNQVELLVGAVKRGVDVRMLLPGPNNDQPLTKSAGRTAYSEMLEGGVKIFEYQPTMIHEKMMVIDGGFAIFGSSNLDARSSEINEELDVAVYDEAFARELEKSFERDLQQSKQYTLDDYRQRSLWERITESFARPFRSQL
jgi:cardiolipin synthase